MDKEKKKYEKPKLVGEKLYETVAASCCKTGGVSTCPTGKLSNKGSCGGTAPST